MNQLYLDCTHGATKDGFARAMLALLDDERREALEELLPEAPMHHAAHEHHALQEVRDCIGDMPITERARTYALGVYDVLARGEAAAHGVDISDVHFHEVGAHDAIAWVCVACAAIDALAPSRIVAGEVCTGFGHIDCSHGRLAVPAPATANILADTPTFEGAVEGELTTPTGAALVVYFAEETGVREPDASTSVQVGR